MFSIERARRDRAGCSTAGSTPRTIAAAAKGLLRDGGTVAAGSASSPHETSAVGEVDPAELARGSSKASAKVKASPRPHAAQATSMYHYGHAALRDRKGREDLGPPLPEPEPPEFVDPVVTGGARYPAVRRATAAELRQDNETRVPVLLHGTPLSRTPGRGRRRPSTCRRLKADSLELGANTGDL